MALKEQIINDIKAALLGGNRFEADVLRVFKSVILNEEVAQGKRDDGLDDSVIEQLLAREVKKRNESAGLYEQAGRQELAADERKEAEILSKYLPKQLSETDLSEIITRVISDMGVSGSAAMGQVIGAVKKEVGNSADGATVARLVKNALS